MTLEKGMEKLREITMLKILHTDEEYRNAMKEVIAQERWSTLRNEDPEKNEKYIEAVKNFNEVMELRKVKVLNEMLKTLDELHGKF